jgi:hypothetical protein
MTLKYLTKEELKALTKDELDKYAIIMTEYQMKILAVMDLWVDAYNLACDEYDRRKPFAKTTLIQNESTTKH